MHDKVRFFQSDTRTPLYIFPYRITAVDLQTQPQLQNDQQDSEGGCMC